MDKAFHWFTFFYLVKQGKYMLKLLQIKKNQLHRFGIIFNPDKIQVDFEIATFSAIRIVFSDASISGCYFHFGQAIWRKIQKLGLVTLYNSDILFRNFVEMLSGIALVSVNDIDSAWDIIKNYYNVENGLVDRLIKYTEDNWLNNNSSLYRREIRSHYGTLKRRTNNS
ncbi:hypothetical protein NCER_102474, partial [Vairimorpha ceranae BRL01]